MEWSSFHSSHPCGPMRIGSKENDLDRAQFLCRARFRVVRRLGSNDSCGTNNSRIVPGIHCFVAMRKFFFVSPEPCISRRHKPSRRASDAAVARAFTRSNRHPRKTLPGDQSAALVFTIPSHTLAIRCIEKGPPRGVPNGAKLGVPFYDRQVARWRATSLLVPSYVGKLAPPGSETPPKQRNTERRQRTPGPLKGNEAKPSVTSPKREPRPACGKGGVSGTRLSSAAGGQGRRSLL
jgi:hypothetical protein